MNEAAENLAPTPRPRTGRLALLCVVVAAAVATAHWPALSARAVSFDDDQYFVSNGLVRNPSVASAWRFLSEVLEPSTVNGYYQPLNMISLMLDAALGATPENLRPLHRTSLALHVVNTMLVLVVLTMMFDHWIAAALVALLFGVHPLTVETIPWLGERKTLLATFFALLSTIAYVRFANVRSAENPASARRVRLTWFVASLVLFVMALMSKPTVTPLALMILLMDIWPLKRIRFAAILEKIPYLVIACVSSIVTFISQARTAGVEMPTPGSPLQIPLKICHNNIFYLWKMILPTHLSSHYPIPAPFDMSDGMIRAGVIGSIIMGIVLFASLRWTRGPIVCWAIYFVGLFPTMQIVGFSNVVASDKYVYFPSIGISILLCAGLAWVFHRTRRITGTLVVAVVFASAAFEFIATQSYLRRAWMDTETLYRYMISEAPNAPTLRSHLGNVLKDQGRLEEALAEHMVAVSCAPRSYAAWNDLGNALRTSGRPADAVRAYERALAVYPDYDVSHRNLGVALADLGQIVEAEKSFAQAVRLKPINPEAYDCWATVLLKQGRFDEARPHLDHALAQRPDYANARNSMGIIYAARGQVSEAIDSFQWAIKSSPDLTEARYNLASLLIGQNRIAEARVHLEHILLVAPGDSEARNLLASLSEASNKPAGP